MSQSRSSISDPEIITPSMQLRLQEVDAKHEIEEAQLARLESLANLMDARFNIPFLSIPVGLDTIIGLIPGIGDTISLGVSGFIVVGAHSMKLPKRHLTQMCGNILIDWAIGLIPIIGDLFDVGWRGNLRNVKIARAHLEERWANERAAALKH